MSPDRVFTDDTDPAVLAVDLIFISPKEELSMTVELSMERILMKSFLPLMKQIIRIRQ